MTSLTAGSTVAAVAGFDATTSTVTPGSTGAGREIADAQTARATGAAITAPADQDGIAPVATGPTGGAVVAVTATAAVTAVSGGNGIAASTTISATTTTGTRRSGDRR